MSADRSFNDYITKKFDNEFWEVAETYLDENRDDIEGRFYRLHRVGEVEVVDVSTDWVWIYNLPDMKIQFHVAMGVNLQASEGDYHYDDYQESTIKLMVKCSGSIDCDFEDMEILSVVEYNGKETIQNPLDDSLVPYISKEQLDETAKNF